MTRLAHEQPRFLGFSIARRADLFDDMIKSWENNELGKMFVMKIGRWRGAWRLVSGMKQGVAELGVLGCLDTEPRHEI